LGKEAGKYHNADLIVGLDSPDDAAVMKIDDDKALVFTADFFAPVVDDAYSYGSVAAANALSDIYAMGAMPQMALNLVAWPEEMDRGVIRDVLKGGLDKVIESGAFLAGGHTVKDAEPKFGLAVTGIVHPDKILRKDRAQVGDLIVLTKPLGSGVITTAVKESKVKDVHLEACINVMSKLNYSGALGAAAIYPHVHAATDVTGYGLIGHGHEMAVGAGCAIKIQSDKLPWISGSHEYAKAGLFSGGAIANKQYYGGFVTYAKELADWKVKLLFDPQTSGGLLLSVQPESALDLLNAIVDNGGDDSCIIGEVVVGQSGNIIVD
jgi:selenide,water dikinase